MRAAYFDGSVLSVRDDYPRPEGETIVRVDMAGVCGTDLEILDGYMSYQGVLGHEFVGTVQESPDKRLDGRRVVGEINAACGVCDACRRGQGRHCPSRTVLGISGRDGAFAELLSLPADNLHTIPDSLQDRQAVFVEPLAAAFEIQEQVRFEKDWRVAVVGDGRLAQLVVMVLRLACPDITCFGRHTGKLQRLQRLGVTTKIGIQKGDEQGFDMVVEASGGTSGFADASRLTRPRGHMVLKSTIADRSDVDLTSTVVNEITVTGSRCGPFRPAIEALIGGAVPVEDMIDAVYSLSDIGQAIQHARRGALKILIKP